MTRGTIPTKTFYLACRADNGVRKSLQLTAEYKGVTVEEICETLGFDPAIGIVEDILCAFKGCKTRLPKDYAKRYAYCPKHTGDLLK